MSTQAPLIIGICAILLLYGIGIILSVAITRRRRLHDRLGQATADALTKASEELSEAYNEQSK